MAKISHLALGDSYTAGTGATPGANWPAQLARLLDGRGFSTAEPVLVARNGWTSANLLAVLDRIDFQRNFDLVTLLIGANDQFDGVPLEEYERNFQNLLGKAITLAADIPKRVIVLSIPDWSVTPFAHPFDRGQVAAQIERFNAINRQGAKAVECGYVDLTAQSRCAATDLTLLGPDRLHPSGKMYANWARFILPVVLGRL
ncbi:MAG: hypothetical protein MAG431_00505 [Chloroflexi bacterium]|nr:hypothetical protein [Chloroflexota bacterium]